MVSARCRVANDHSNWRQYYVIAIDGNFDDAQTNVKHMFNDVELREKLAANKLQIFTANSMNIGRLVPLIVYYVYAYAQLVKTSGEIVAGDKVNFTVPTGNLKYLGCLLCNKSVWASW